MKYGGNKVSVIVPTLAEKERQAQIRRCIESIHHSSQRPVDVIVVVNGDRRDPGVVSWLQDQKGLLIAYEPTPSLPIAVLRGRALVESEYFCLLDDDDEYLAGATDERLAALNACPDADLVVTNGFRRIRNMDVPAQAQLKLVPSAPLARLFESNWLASCGALYRSAAVGLSYFADPFPFLEWTWLAFKLAVDRKRVLVLDRPGYRIHLTPGSLSQSDSYKDALIRLYRRMLDKEERWETKPLPPAIRQTIRTKLSAAYHDRASRLLDEGERVPALEAHLQSLLLSGGLRYLPFSRKVLPGWSHPKDRSDLAHNDEVQSANDNFPVSIDEGGEPDLLHRNLSVDCAGCRSTFANQCFQSQKAA